MNKINEVFNSGNIKEIIMLLLIPIFISFASYQYHFQKLEKQIKYISGEIEKKKKEIKPLKSKLSKIQNLNEIKKQLPKLKRENKKNKKLLNFISKKMSSINTIILNKNRWTKLAKTVIDITEKVDVNILQLINVPVEEKQRGIVSVSDRIMIVGDSSFFNMIQFTNNIEKSNKFIEIKTVEYKLINEERVSFKLVFDFKKVKL